MSIDRLPALPLIANDPYFSIWLPGDTLTDAHPVHWSGEVKDMTGVAEIDGRRYRFLSGRVNIPAMKTTALRVTPTATISVMEAAGVELTVTFQTPALPDDLDALSTPITFVRFAARAVDGRTHKVAVRMNASSTLCYNDSLQPMLSFDHYVISGLNVAFVGQTQQRVLGHSGDRITIDWGYLYIASPDPVSVNADGVGYEAAFTVSGDTVHRYLMLGYDDIASINYFGALCRAWYARNGKTLVQALVEFAARKDRLFAACDELDARVLEEAMDKGGADYALIAAAGWRHTFAAHKLIATPEGEMALLSKENDSNGCIGTVDVSYPSIPIFLKYCPELVNALCRPVLAFAEMPVWGEDFAPHDVGRYPYATGQVYAAGHIRNGNTPLPYYLYPAGVKVYNPRYQMPVEECGNMLVMLETAVSFGAKDDLLRKHAETLRKWVRYLDEFGEDPGEQLCTDDFAGHLARNVNLSAKAVVGIACYARILKRLGHDAEARRWDERAHAMAKSWLERARTGDFTALTFDRTGWSMKYNLVWDLVLNLNLLPVDFYARETDSYLPRVNEFGLPLDSRADYTKSDWLIWTASMAQSSATFRGLIAPLAHCLRTTDTRVPFSDWYDTRSGRFVSFIARSVQGGLYMPMLVPKKP